jgi:site-specific recombinase XerD
MELLAVAVHLISKDSPSPMARLIDDYLTHCAARGLAPRTIEKSYGYALNDVFLPWCADEGVQDLPQLDRRMIDRFTASLLARHHEDGRPISKHTVHSYVRPVRQLLTWASREGEDVKAKPQLPQCSPPLREVLNRQEIDDMENVMFAERDKLIIRLFGDCGLRLNELTDLKPQDIIRSGHQAHLRVLGKRSRWRDVPIPPQLLRRLERLINGRPVDRREDAIFLALRRSPMGLYDPLTSSGVYQVVKDAVARARIGKRVYPHLMRHSWMTEMLRNGMSPIQLSIIAGASVQVISDHYTHLTRDDAYEAMMRVLARHKG